MRTDVHLIIGAGDAERLSRLLEQLDSRHTDTISRLEAELARARIVPDDDLPPDVVAMESTVVFDNLTDGKRREVVLVYPDRADAAAGRISVLSPIGSALLGLREGGEIAWPLPRGRVARLRVIEARRPSLAGFSAAARRLSPRVGGSGA